MSYHFTPDTAQEQGFDWNEFVDWPADMILEPLGSFEAGQSGRPENTTLGCVIGSSSESGPVHLSSDNLFNCPANTHHDVMQHIGYDASLSYEVDKALTNDTAALITQGPAAQGVGVESPSVSPGRATLNTVPRSQRRKRGHAHTCDKPGCEGRTFSRKFELRRHIRTSHGGESGTSLKRFVCGAQGCFDKQSPWAFKRADKLTSHIKACHRRDTVFTQCPVSNCVYGPATLEELGVHIRRVHQWNEAARAVMNASPCKVYRCPIWTCRNHLDVQAFPAHMENKHSVDEVYAAVQDLNADGFVIDHPNGVPGFALGVICPVCHAACENVEQFVKHILSSHLCLASSGGDEHFVAWRAALALNFRSYTRARVSEIQPWTQYLCLEFLVKTRTINCPACPFSVTFSDDWGRRVQEEDMVENHHLTLLRPTSEVVSKLKPYRFQILRLYPEFVTHPVFDDFGPL